MLFTYCAARDYYWSRVSLPQNNDVLRPRDVPTGLVLPRTIEQLSRSAFRVLTRVYIKDNLRSQL